MSTKKIGHLDQVFGTKILIQNCQKSNFLVILPYFRGVIHSQTYPHAQFFCPIIWKKVEEYLRLFETCGEIQISVFPVGLLRKLMLFSGRMRLRMKLTAKKELNLLFQMTPSRILCDQ